MIETLHNPSNAGLGRTAEARAERERMARERGDAAVAESAGRALMQLAAQRDLLKQQISEAKASAARARALREERRVQGEDLANETHPIKSTW